MFTIGQGQLARRSTGVLLIQQTCKLALLERQEGQIEPVLAALGCHHLEEVKPAVLSRQK